jgi:hypothetical protein
MTLSSRILPDGTHVPGTTSGVIQLTDGAPHTLTAPLTIPGTPHGYCLNFWIADFDVFPVQEPGDSPEPQQTINFTTPAGLAFAATAWYRPRAGSPPGVLAWAFSVNQDTTLPASPFGTVLPATAHKDANTVSTTASSQPAVITATKLIAGAGRFGSWLQLSGDGTVNGATLTVPAGGSSVAVALYSIPVPDPCQPIRDQLAYLHTNMPPPISAASSRNANRNTANCPNPATHRRRQPCKHHRVRPKSQDDPAAAPFSQDGGALGVPAGPRFSAWWPPRLC